MPDESLRSISQQLGHLSGKMEVMAQVQADTNARIAKILDAHDARLDGLEKDRAKVYGFMSAIGIFTGGTGAAIGAAFAKMFGGGS